MEVGYYSPAFLKRQARALVTMEVLWRADPVLCGGRGATPVPTATIHNMLPVSGNFLHASWRKMLNDDAMRDAISYIRVSGDEQADSGAGLEAQCQRIDAYCQMNDST